MADNSSVKVALRIRPLIDSEKTKGCREILEVYPDIRQVRIQNTEKAFTYNHIFDSASKQEELYLKCVQSLISHLFEGYNVTVLAYGQTGSGKTYTMGTTYAGLGEMGVLPRAVFDIFASVKDQFSYEFIISVSFMELYQEVLYDLLSDKPREQCALDIREDPTKGIVIQGLTEITVKSPAEVLLCLSKGAQGRATGSTNMNMHSSRSHAIFTINILMQSKADINNRKTAKFTLVDLAGSERCKKTGAVGTTFKEGVNINKGLLVLGNVISALGDEKGQHGYINYRDSNLTRLLKDSLGGNSITLMVACVSPADYNVEETISTLRYADRAKQIKNKPIVNQDAKTAEILELRKTIQQLKLQIIGQASGDPVVSFAEIELKNKEIANLQSKLSSITFQLSSVLNDNTGLLEKVLLLQTANENLSKQFSELSDDYNVVLDIIKVGVEESDIVKIKQGVTKLKFIQQQFQDIDCEQKKLEVEVRNHESTLTAQLHNSSNSKDAPVEAEIAEKQSFFTNNQLALKSELEEITARLALKEQLALQIQNNMQSFIDCNLMRETEDKIAALEKEKEELLQQLKTVQSKDVSCKIAEQRRKRVQELESELQNLKKKVQEQARLIKLKEKDELKIKNLNSEIMQMKQDKVKLIKKMREETEKYRTWRTQRERELAKLKQEDRKKQNQLVKMEVLHSKQQNVLKRKVEEAVAMNKRLKEALALRKDVQDHRMNGKAEKVGQWLKKEMDVYVDVIEAETTLADLLEDRATIQKQINDLKNDSFNDNAEAIKSLEADVELRSLHIQEIQQRILDLKDDNKEKIRWDNIQTMAEAKIVFKTLWELVAEIKRNEVKNALKFSELQAQNAELKEKEQQLQKEKRKLSDMYNEEVANLQKEYNEKVSILLNQLRGKPLENIDEQYQKMLHIHQEKMDELEKSNAELLARNNELTAKNNELNEKLQVINETLKKEDLPKTPPNKNNKKTKKPKEPEKENHCEIDLDISDEILLEDDPDKDPDWRKTPMGKRILEERKKIKERVAYMENLGVKRSSDGGCTCGRNCTNRCGCMKSSKPCTSSCKCPLECANRARQNDGDANTSDTSQNDSKKSRLTEFAFPKKSSRNRKPLFGMPS